MAKPGIQAPAGKMDVYISAESVITGDLQTKSNIKVDGRVQGNINAAGSVQVGGSALVEGNITGMDIQIAGIVNGNITATGELVLYESAKLAGDVKAAAMEVENGASYRGNMVIGADPVREGARIIKEPVAPANAPKAEEIKLNGLKK